MPQPILANNRDGFLILVGSKMKNGKPHILLPTTLILVVTLAVSLLLGAAAAPDRVHITIMGTTDLHGNILPIDYYTARRIQGL